MERCGWDFDLAELKTTLSPESSDCKIEDAAFLVDAAVSLLAPVAAPGGDLIMIWRKL